MDVAPWYYTWLGLDGWVGYLWAQVPTRYYLGWYRAVLKLSFVLWKVREGGHCKHCRNCPPDDVCPERLHLLLCGPFDTSLGHLDRCHPRLWFIASETTLGARSTILYICAFWVSFWLYCDQFAFTGAKQDKSCWWPKATREKINFLGGMAAVTMLWVRRVPWHLAITLVRSSNIITNVRRVWVDPSENGPWPPSSSTPASLPSPSSCSWVGRKTKKLDGYFGCV